MRARWAKAACAAATFSGLPDQAFCGAACSARLYEKLTFHGRRTELVHGVEPRRGIDVGLSA